MSMVNELYASVYEKLKAVQTKYENAENQLQASKEQDEVAKQKRIENLQLQLKKSTNTRRRSVISSRWLKSTW